MSGRHEYPSIKEKLTVDKNNVSVYVAFYNMFDMNNVYVYVVWMHVMLIAY